MTFFWRLFSMENEIIIAGDKIEPRIEEIFKEIIEKIYHKMEAIRIEKELDNLSDNFAENGIVKTVLRARILQEKSYESDKR